MSHPHIICSRGLIENGKLKETGFKTYKNVPYLILELADIGELFTFITMGGKLSERYARYFFKQLIDGLGYLHERGFSHRDLKLDNLLLTENFDLKIADLGFAVNLKDSPDGFQRGKMGTLGYQAPEIREQVRYKGDQTDVWAAGVILFQILAC